MGRIRTVSYRRNVQLREFVHVHIEASADVAPGEEPAVVLREVQRFVQHELAEQLRKAREPKPPRQEPG